MNVDTLQALQDLRVTCPDCGELVVQMPAQGGLRLDWPAVPRETHPAAMFAIMELSPGVFLAGSNGDRSGNGHELHVHQPDGIT